MVASSTRTATRPPWARVVRVRFWARFVTLIIVRRQVVAVVGPGDQAWPRALVRRHNRCAARPSKGPVLVPPARYGRVGRGLTSRITPRLGGGMDTIRRYRMLIGGDWVDADERFEIRSPATEEPVASVAKGGLEHADRAVAAARAAHADGRWRQTPPAQRAALLDAIADRLTERIDELAVLEALENGAPVRQAGAFQIGFSIAHLRYFAGQARSYAFERPGPLLRVPTLADGLVRREPVGVCGAIVPWNFPLLLAMWKIGPALAAGNTMVIKPDEQTPMTLLEFARAAQECGLPPGVLNIVPGEGPVVGAELARHPDVRKIAFTGSTAVGREIMRMAAGNVKRLTLELGGKGPNIVLDDADLDLAADGTLFGCLMNQGQACESGTRIIVAAAVHDKFVERLIERARTISIGDPLDMATDFGPVISAEARDRILRYIGTGRAEGATLAYGGGVPAGA